MFPACECGQVRKRLWADMEADGLVLKKDPYKNRVPRSQRGGEVVEPLISDQWSVSIERAHQACPVSVQPVPSQCPPSVQSVPSQHLGSVFRQCVQSACTVSMSSQDTVSVSSQRV